MPLNVSVCLSQVKHSPPIQSAIVWNHCGKALVIVTPSVCQCSVLMQSVNAERSRVLYKHRL